MALNVIAVVVTYNRIELLKECIASIKNQHTEAELKTIIIDNNSNDGTQNYILSLDDKSIIYYNTGENLGGAGGFEYGIRKAVEHECDCVWIMDDDCIPQNDALQQLLDVGKEKKEYGFLASYVQWIDGNICSMNIPRISISRKLKYFDEDIIPVQYATFVSILIPTNIIKQVGVPIGDFFIWFDDWEYTRRISRIFSCYFVKQSIVIHKTLHNSGYDLATDTKDRIERYKIAFRNEMFVIRREKLRGTVYWILKICKNIIRILFISNNYRMKRLRVMFSGIKDGFMFKPNIHKI